LALGAAGAPAASAQGPVITGGLVNVTVVDAVDIEDVLVQAQVPIGIAANVCGVNVGVLAAGFAQGGNPECTATGQAAADIVNRFPR
jgi:hypothetical protein